MVKEKLVRDNIFYLSGNILNMVTSLIKGFFLARVLGPAAYGAWNGFYLILMYNKMSPVGLLDGYDREYPYCLGKGDEKKADSIKNTSFSVMMLISFAVGLSLMGISFVLEGKWDPAVIFGLRIFSVVVVLDQLYEFYIEYLRSRRDFSTLSLFRVAFSTINILLVIPLTYVWGLKGLFIATLLCFILFALVIGRNLSSQIALVVDKELLRHLWKVGFPIFLTTILSIMLISMDRIMVLNFLGTEKLGYYGLSAFFIGFIQMLLGNVSYVTYPHMLDKYGREGNVLALRRYLFDALEVMSILSPLVIGAIWIAAPAIFFYILPQYFPALPVVRILLVGSFFFCLASYAIIFMTTINQQKKVLKFQVAAILLAFLLSYTLIDMGFGMVGVAAAMTTSYIIYGLSLVSYSFSYFQMKKGEVVSKVLTTCVTFVLVLILIVGMELLRRKIGETGIFYGGPRVVALELGVFVLFGFSILYLLSKRSPVLGELLEAIKVNFNMGKVW